MLKLALNANESIMYFICCFKGDKNEVFAGCGDNNIYVWDLESGAQKVRFTVKVLIFMKTNFYGLENLPLFMGFFNNNRNFIWLGTILLLAFSEPRNPRKLKLSE